MKFRARVTGHVNIRPEDRLLLRHTMLDGADFTDRELLQISVQASRLTNCRFDKIQFGQGTGNFYGGG